MQNLKDPCYFIRNKVSGGDTEGDPPVPIPNTEVKPFRADDTMAARSWESRTLPDLIYPFISQTVIFKFICFPFLNTLTSIVFPAGVPATNLGRSDIFFTSFPSKAMIISPLFIPPESAGPP